MQVLHPVALGDAHRRQLRVHALNPKPLQRGTWRVTYNYTHGIRLKHDASHTGHTTHADALPVQLCHAAAGYHNSACAALGRRPSHAGGAR